MDKVVRQATQRARVVGRRIAKNKKHVEHLEMKELLIGRREARRAQARIIKDDQTQQKELWLRGGLAAKSGIGKRREVDGTVPQQLVAIPPLPKKDRLEWWHIKVGDRVAVMKGHFMGRISSVQHVDEERSTVHLENIRTNVAVPESYQQFAQGSKTATQPLPISLDDVRLVYPLPDPVTGQMRDVLIEKLVPAGREWDRHKRKLTDGYRVINGTNTIIPWPAELEEKHEVYPDDTPQDLVQQETFRPSLMVAPMPTKILDELRGKNSRFRHRRTYKEIMKMEAKAAVEERRSGLQDTMRTPLRELADLRIAEKQANEKELTDEQLEAIGKVILKAKQGATAAVKALRRPKMADTAPVEQ